jgi:hypothetical protein
MGCERSYDRHTMRFFLAGNETCFLFNLTLVRAFSRLKCITFPRRNIGRQASSLNENLVERLIVSNRGRSRRCMFDC